MTATAPLTAAPVAAAVSLDTGWPRLRLWILFYSWTTIGATAYGLFLAHAFIFIGTPWSNCPNLTAVLAVHLLEVPLALYPLGVALYAIRRLDESKLPKYGALLGFVNVSNLVFFLFEVQLVLGGTLRGAPEMDNWLTLSIAVILLSAVLLGVAIRTAIEVRLHGSGRRERT